MEKYLKSENKCANEVVIRGQSDGRQKWPILKQGEAVDGRLPKVMRLVAVWVMVVWSLSMPSWSRGRYEVESSKAIHRYCPTC